MELKEEPCFIGAMFTNRNGSLKALCFDFPKVKKLKKPVLVVKQTLSTSPRCTRSTLMTCSLITFIVPACNFTNKASEGCNDKSLARASDVFPFATCSIQRPSEINTSSMGGVSKKVIGLCLLCSAMATATTII